MGVCVDNNDAMMIVIALVKGVMAVIHVVKRGVKRVNIFISYLDVMRLCRNPTLKYNNWLRYGI